jgi:hypothetical protein
MESTVTTSNYPVPTPDEILQATFRVNIKVQKDLKTGEVKTFINELDMSNYDGLIKDVPTFLAEYNIRYALNLIQEYLKTQAL